MRRKWTMGSAREAPNTPVRASTVAYIYIYIYLLSQVTYGWKDPWEHSVLIREFIGLASFFDLPAILALPCTEGVIRRLIRHHLILSMDGGWNWQWNVDFPVIKTNDEHRGRLYSLFFCNRQSVLEYPRTSTIHPFAYGGSLGTPCRI